MRSSQKCVAYFLTIQFIYHNDIMQPLIHLKDAPDYFIQNDIIYSREGLIAAGQSPDTEIWVKEIPAPLLDDLKEWTLQYHSLMTSLSCKTFILPPVKDVLHLNNL